MPHTKGGGMEIFMKLSPKLAHVGKECVACGCCEAVCPKQAICVVSGVIAQVKEEVCIGCGKCAKTCPAAVITIIKRGTV